MKRKIYFGILVLLTLLIFWQFPASGQAEQLRCIAFSPYVDDFYPNWPPYPSPQLIEQLLDHIIARTGFRCVQTYGVLEGLDYIIEAAEARGLKVVMGVWLDTDIAVNAASISLGIQKAKQFPKTVVRISCGTEVRNRLGSAAAEPIIQNCLNQMKTAGVIQPITAIDTWWQWCNESWPCQFRALANQLDWIGVNVYPWWENKYSGIFTCTPADKAPDFHLARINNIIERYPGKPVMLTEFGWPAGCPGYRETNLITGEQCGEASEFNQNMVIRETIKMLDKAGYDFSLFEAYREKWKANEGLVGPWWGICDGKSPYLCHGAYGYVFKHQIFLPFIKK